MGITEARPCFMEEDDLAFGVLVELLLLVDLFSSVSFTDFSGVKVIVYGVPVLVTLSKLDVELAAESLLVVKSSGEKYPLSILNESE